MKKTSFEIFLEESARKTWLLTGKALSPRELMDIFFPEKIARKVTEYKPKGEKNAIVLVGPSCSGKTTFALKFVEEHPDFSVVSMDECAAKDMEELGDTGFIMLALGITGNGPDDLGNRRFGRMLEAGHKGIIIDGNWMHVNARGALLKTLEKYGYHTCLFVFVPSQEGYDYKIKQRVLDVIASNKTGISLARRLEGVDIVKCYADSLNITVEELKSWIENSKEFRDLYEDECVLLANDLVDAEFQEQISSPIIFLGADEILLKED